MGLLADEPAASPYPPIVLRGLAAAELDCLAALVLGDGAELAPLTSALAGSRFADPARGALFDLVAGDLRLRPALTVADRLLSVPATLVDALSTVLQWSDRPGFEPTAAVFCAAREALCHEPRPTRVVR